MKTAANSSTLRGVLFDWDGTLLNSHAADTAAYLAMFRAMGIPWGLAELKEHYSPNWYSVYRTAKLPKRHWDAADKAWRENYASQRPKLIRGARRVLARIGSRHRLGLVTSGDRDRVHKQLKEFDLFEAFDARVCAGDTAERKPHPAPLQLALRRMRLAPESTVYVGDAPEDLQMARSAGVRAAIAVLGPFPTEKRLRAARPDALLESILELPAVLNRFL